MKKLSIVLGLVLGLGLAVHQDAYGETISYSMQATFMNEIPGRFAFMVLTGADPRGIAKEPIIQAAKEYMTERSLKSLQYIIYNKDQEPGGGALRAIGALKAEGQKEIKESMEFHDFANKDDQQTREQMAMAEKVLGCYEMEPKELWEAYSDNEVVADDDFKNKCVLMQITVPSVSKDISDTPYISVSADKHGFSGVNFRFAKDDPFIRKIKKGSKIVVRGYPQGMMLKDVSIKAEIVDIE